MKPKAMLDFDLSAEFLTVSFDKRTFHYNRLALHLCGSLERMEEEFDCLGACANMMEIYKLLPEATISTRKVLRLNLQTPLRPTSS